MWRQLPLHILLRPHRGLQPPLRLAEVAVAVAEAEVEVAVAVAVVALGVAGMVVVAGSAAGTANTFARLAAD